MVINLDDNTGPGTHWVAARLIGHTLYYADPFGTTMEGYPPEEIRGGSKKIVANSVTWQRPETHLCGYYAAQFVKALNSLDGTEPQRELEAALWESIK